MTLSKTLPRTLAALGLLAVVPSLASAAPTARLGLLAAPPSAPPRKGPPGAPRKSAVPEAWLTQLRSSDEAQLKSAFDEVRAAGESGAAAAPAVTDALLQGLPPALAEAGLATLTEVSAAAGVPAFVLYMHHRQSSVRRAAARGLAKAGGPEAVAALQRLLRDGDAGVRGLAATGLGALRAREAVPDLVLALERRVPEAAVALGRSCEGAACDGLLAHTGTVPFSIIGPGLEALVLRPAAEVDEPRKLRVVSAVRELGTHEGHELLKRLAAALGNNASPALSQALREAIAATEASP
jgi:HEAT repeat protein